MSKRVLVGDIGGTNSRWAIFDGALGPVTVTRTRDARSLGEAAHQFLQGRTVDACCVAVAGPVEEGSATLTNADWIADPRAMSVPTRVLNDLEGAAYGVVGLAGEDIEWSGSGSSFAAKTLVLGVGTGFGGAVLDSDVVVPLEPGHDRLVPANPEIFYGLLDATTTVEDVVSGPGLVHMWEHFRIRLALQDTAEPTDLGEWLLANAEADAVAKAVCTAFRHALVDATVSLAGHWSVQRVVFMGGVIEGWFDYLGKVGAWEDIENRTGCVVGRIRHPYPGLLGAGLVGQSLIST